MGDHGIVDGISIFRDVEILLDNTPSVGEERPVGTDSASIFTRLSNIVRANRDKPAIGNLELAMKYNKPFGLASILGAETSAAKDENQWMLSLQFGKLSALCGMVGKLVVGEDSSWNNVRSHIKTLKGWLRVEVRLTGPGSRHKSGSVWLPLQLIHPALTDKAHCPRPVADFPLLLFAALIVLAFGTSNAIGPLAPVGSGLAHLENQATAKNSKPTALIPKTTSVKNRMLCQTFVSSMCVFFGEWFVP
jgi:hypothetical protein